MKKILVLACASALFLFSCTKSSSSSSNTFTIGSSTQTAVIVQDTLGSISGLSMNGKGLVFQFYGTTSPAAGTYDLVTLVPSSANQVSVYGITDDSISYWSKKNTEVKVTVAVSGNKKTVSVPSVMCIRYDVNFNATDSLLVSGSLTH